MRRKSGSWPLYLVDAGAVDNGQKVAAALRAELPAEPQAYAKIRSKARSR